MASKKAILGARLKANSPVDCGEVTVVVDEHSVTRVPKLPSTSLFATAEHDWLMYHDVDIALFHGNLQAMLNNGIRPGKRVGAAGCEAQPLQAALLRAVESEKRKNRQAAATSKQCSLCLHALPVLASPPLTRRNL